MPNLQIKYCPGTLAEGYGTYSRQCLKKVYDGKSVSPILPYNSPLNNLEIDTIFDANRLQMSLSGVQEKFSVLLEKNKLRLTKEREPGTYILKPIPTFGKKADQMPANEHLTMQIASQIYKIETAENALIFFKNGEPAYITKRFDVRDAGSKWAQEDFASLAGRTPQTHGEHYKYLGNYLELFKIMQGLLPAYTIEAIRLYKLLIFNYLFSNGDAHFKNFSILETAMGDYRLSPAYDLLNSRMHVDDKDFALEEGLVPKNIAKGKISMHFKILAQNADIHAKYASETMEFMISKSKSVEKLIAASFLSENSKRNYLQAYQAKIRKLKKE